MWWIITPLIVTLILMTFYFGRHKGEELGYNTAVGNSVLLLFIGVDLLRYLWYTEFPPSLLAYQHRPIATILILIVMVESLTLMFSSYFQTLPKKLAYFLCSPLPVNLQGYVVIAVVYSNIKFDWYTFVAALVLFILLLAILRLMQLFQHITRESVHKAKIEEAKTEEKKADELKKEAKKKSKELKKKEKEHKKK